MSDRVKIKGRKIIVDGDVVGEIRGWRDPSGRFHVPYMIRLADGRKIQGFAYADDARRYARYHPDELKQ